jgi:hypothetical protein
VVNPHWVFSARFPPAGAVRCLRIIPVCFFAASLKTEQRPQYNWQTNAGSRYDLTLYRCEITTQPSLG